MQSDKFQRCTHTVMSSMLKKSVERFSNTLMMTEELQALARGINSMNAMSAEGEGAPGDDKDQDIEKLQQVLADCTPEWPPLEQAVAAAAELLALLKTAEMPESQSFPPVALGEHSAGGLNVHVAILTPSLAVAMLRVTKLHAARGGRQLQQLLEDTAAAWAAMEAVRTVDAQVALELHRLSRGTGAAPDSRPLLVLNWFEDSAHKTGKNAALSILHAREELLQKMAALCDKDEYQCLKDETKYDEKHGKEILALSFASGRELYTSWKDYGGLPPLAPLLQKLLPPGTYSRPRTYCQNWNAAVSEAHSRFVLSETATLPRVKKGVAVMTAAQSLWKPLTAGSRKTLCRMCLESLQSCGLELPPALETLLRSEAAA